jgi:excisionase family DNA binding protein
MTDLESLPVTITVEQAGQILGVARGTAYEAARTGQLPVIRLGRRLLVPRARLLELLGEPNGSNGEVAPTSEPQDMTP